MENFPNTIMKSLLFHNFPCQIRQFLAAVLKSKFHGKFCDHGIPGGTENWDHLRNKTTLLFLTKDVIIRVSTESFIWVSVSAEEESNPEQSNLAAVLEQSDKLKAAERDNQNMDVLLLKSKAMNRWKQVNERRKYLLQVGKHVSGIFSKLRKGQKGSQGFCCDFSQCTILGESCHKMCPRKKNQCLRCTCSNYLKIILSFFRMDCL